MNQHLKNQISSPQLYLVLVCVLLNSTCAFPKAEGPAKVEIKKKGENGYQIIRNGEPYFVKGAGGQNYLEQLKAAGGNSIRTWGVGRGTQRVLDQAHSLGLTVTLGIWLGHKRHGFDYNNPIQVKNQFENAKRAVMRYKDHPAVLFWGVGNEMEMDESNYEAVYTAVNDIAKMIKEIDPNHPTITIISEVGDSKVSDFIEYCPDVDALGINSYGGAASVPDRMKGQGYTGPYMITEFGPRGWWEVAKTDWGMPIEQTSTDKERTYAEFYEAAVESHPQCLGSYIFLWGWKQEKTHTWFNMFLPNGKRTGSVDAMTRKWSGKHPENRSPQIAGDGIELEINGQPVGWKLSAGTTVTCMIKVEDPEGEELEHIWELRKDVAGNQATGGDFEQGTGVIKEALVENKNDQAIIKIPSSSGNYRIFFYAYDKHNNAATANVPILVTN